MTESDNSFVAVNVDEAAFRKVFDRYYPRMLAFLRSFLQSDDDAEDVAQNVFVKLWMKREVLLDREYLDIYLFRMTVNFAINFSKVRKRHVGLEDIDLPDELDPGKEFDSRKRLDTIFKAVSEMPEKRREVFILSRLHGMSHKEIAEKLNVSAKTHINSKHIPVTIGRAAEIIGLAKPSLYRYTANGLIPCYKRGKRLYFFEDELYDWIRRGKLEELEIAHKDDPYPLVQLTPRQSKKRF